MLLEIKLEICYIILLAHIGQTWNKPCAHQRAPPLHFQAPFASPPPALTYFLCRFAGPVSILRTRLDLVAMLALTWYFLYDFYKNSHVAIKLREVGLAWNR